MIFELTIPSVLSLVTVVILLSVFARSDILTRRVPNTQILLAMFIGVIVIVLSGHLILSPINHVLSLIIVTPVSYSLWRLGSIGGADAKCIVVIAMISPGLELAEGRGPLFEVISGNLLQVLIMLICGHFYQRLIHHRRQSQMERVSIPLIPFLLLAYVVTQMLGVFW